ncbi:o-succinylbenzoate synthase [Synechococcales cyanobacterium C]|uniref:o-succinylbenzoate synthase n=2 Tax=Petrachloros TaxID=2918834 RepID=A0A8K2A862_9CYAN|nr:o-succinylbenzoate synthase [Petrachloros mirabilis ULC683]
MPLKPVSHQDNLEGQRSVIRWRYQQTFTPYAHTFRRLLQTHHGEWAVREGIIVQLQDPWGRMGWGEIAPLPWFGSETLEQALAFCRQLSNPVPVDSILVIPDHLPCCQFGWGSAWESLTRSVRNIPQGFRHCGLLPAGRAALQIWPSLWQQGYRTFKWKIGVGDGEQDCLAALLEALPPTARLRLDANGGLTLAEAEAWLNLNDQRIEYLEQPLPTHRLSEMMGLARQFKIPLALDESVATVAQLQDCLAQGWPGIVILKPSIAGYPWKLRQLCQTQPLDIVVSSVFETAVGRQACLNLAQEIANPHRAQGFGVDLYLS